MSKDSPSQEPKVRLLIRLDANDYPNRQDFLMQLAAKNMLKGPLDLVEILGKSYARLTSMSSATLNLLLRGDPAVEKVAPNIRSVQNNGLGKQSRICPECSASATPPHPYFNFSLPIPCWRHEIMPIDECPSCHRPLSYLREHVGYCNCGFNLAAAPRVPKPKWLSRFFTRFAQWRKTIPLNASYSELAEHYASSGLVVRVLIEEYPNNFKSASSASWIKLKELLAMERFVLDWETSFAEFAKALENEATNSQRKAVYSVLKRSKSKAIIKYVTSMEKRIKSAARLDVESGKDAKVSDFRK